MVRQTVKNPSNLQIVWDDGAVLVFSFAGAAADGGATVSCGIAGGRGRQRERALCRHRRAVVQEGPQVRGPANP
jgi:hypothetical protein